MPERPVGDDHGAAAPAGADLRGAQGAVEVTVDGEALLIVPARAVPYAVGQRQRPDRGAAVVRRVATLLDEVGDLQAELSAERRAQLVRAMMNSDIDPVPAATLAQARRLALQRERLLASGAYDMAALQATRNDASRAATRTWLARRRKAGQLFTVSLDGATLLPAFQLDPDGTPRPVVADVLACLARAGLGPWEIWTWFRAASTWLDGRRPVDVLDHPERVVRAAHRFASNAA